MGSGASVLQGSPIGVEVRGGIFGYGINFPPDHWVWHEGRSTASCSTTVPEGAEEAEEEEARDRTREREWL